MPTTNHNIPRVEEKKMLLLVFFNINKELYNMYKSTKKKIYDGGVPISVCVL